MAEMNEVTQAIINALLNRLDSLEERAEKAEANLAAWREESDKREAQWRTEDKAVTAERWAKTVQENEQRLLISVVTEMLGTDAWCLPPDAFENRMKSAERNARRLIEYVRTQHA